MTDPVKNLRKTPYTLNSIADERDARALAMQIEGYWADRGHPNVMCRIEQFGKNGGPIYAVRSNLIDGLPPPIVRNSR